MIGEESNAKFSLRISRASHSHGDDSYRITIQDEASRMRVVELRLTARQFAEAVTGLGVDNVDGDLVSGPSRALLGRRMENYSVVLPRRLSADEVDDWAKFANMKLHAESVEKHTTNGGWRVTFRWYLAADAEPLDLEMAKELTPPIPTDAELMSRGR